MVNRHWGIGRWPGSGSSRALPPVRAASPEVLGAWACLPRARRRRRCGGPPIIAARRAGGSGVPGAVARPTRARRSGRRTTAPAHPRSGAGRYLSIGRSGRGRRWEHVGDLASARAAPPTRRLRSGTEHKTEARDDPVLLCTQPHESCIDWATVMRIPTQLGDVLILQTEQGVKIHAVGRVIKSGQQDFHHIEPPPLYVVDHDETLTVARTLVAPGRRIFLVRDRQRRVVGSIPLRRVSRGWTCGLDPATDPPKPSSGQPCEYAIAARFPGRFGRSNGDAGKGLVQPWAHWRQTNHTTGSTDG